MAVHLGMVGEKSQTTFASPGLPAFPVEVPGMPADPITGAVLKAYVIVGVFLKAMPTE